MSVAGEGSIFPAGYRFGGRRLGGQEESMLGKEMGRGGSNRLTQRRSWAAMLADTGMS